MENLFIFIIQRTLIVETWELLNKKKKKNIAPVIGGIKSSDTKIDKSIAMITIFDFFRNSRVRPWIELCLAATMSRFRIFYPTESIIALLKER